MCVNYITKVTNLVKKQTHTQNALNKCSVKEIDTGNKGVKHSSFDM